jgi:hypothetical protein
MMLPKKQKKKTKTKRKTRPSEIQLCVLVGEDWPSPSLCPGQNLPENFNKITLKGET